MAPALRMTRSIKEKLPIFFASFTGVFWRFCGFTTMRGLVWAGVRNTGWASFFFFFNHSFRTYDILYSPSINIVHVH